MASATFLHSPTFSSRINKGYNGVPAIRENQQIRLVSTKFDGMLSWNRYKPDLYGSILLKRSTKDHYPIVRAIESENSGLVADPMTPVDVIRHFHDVINNRNLTKLDKLISDDCFYEDECYVDPFEGKKEVMKFLTELAESMGKNVNLVVDRMYEGKDLTVGVLWHMEWNGKVIPFSRGCSFYDCCEHEHERRLVIKRCYSVVEFPIKPGSLVLKLLKLISAIFDQFPVAAENILLKHRDLIMFIIKWFKKFIEPLILSVFVYYSSIWKFLSPIIIHLLKGLTQIFRYFTKQDK